MRAEKSHASGVADVASENFGCGPVLPVIVPHLRALRTPTRGDWNVYARNHVVRGARGKERMLLLVACAYCHETHMHTANPDFVSGRRKAACRRGSYIVHGTGGVS